MVHNDLGVAIPYHDDRSKMVAGTIQNCNRFPFIREIVITMEPGASLNQSLVNKKVKVFNNPERLYVFRNKVEAVKRCRAQWVALIDSDNIVGTQYFSRFLSDRKTSEEVIYCPERGMPNLRYDKFGGLDFTMRDAADALDQPGFDMLLNTMNYIFHRETWLRAVQCALDDKHEPLSSDSVWINYHCMKAGMVLRIVKDMVYRHVVHKGSFYAQNAEKGVVGCRAIFEMIRKAAEGEGPEVIRKSIEDLNWSGSR